MKRVTVLGTLVGVGALSVAVAAARQTPQPAGSRSTRSRTTSSC